MFEFFSMGMLPLFIVIAVVIPLIIYAVQAQRHREALVRGWAAARGCSYLPTNQVLVPYLRGEPFVGGRSAKVLEFIDGVTPSGRTFCSFNYNYEVSSGSDGSSHTVNRAIVMVRLPAVLPTLSLSYERFGDKVSKFFGGQDIELESDEFNQMFRVKSPVEAFAYAVLHPRMMEWLMGPASAAVPFVIDGQDLICWHVGLPDYDTLDRRLAYMCEFIDQIPPNVWEKYGAPPQLCWWSSPQLPSSVTSGRSTWRLKRRPEIAP